MAFWDTAPERVRRRGLLNMVYHPPLEWRFLENFPMGRVPRAPTAPGRGLDAFGLSDDDRLHPGRERHSDWLPSTVVVGGRASQVVPLRRMDDGDGDLEDLDFSHKVGNDIPAVR